jgi:predicted dehydrogenase
MVQGKLGVAVIGLGFGRSFVPIYQRHPEVGKVAICESNADLLREIGDQYGVQDRFSSLEDVLSDDRFDAIHLLTPVPMHVDHTLKVLEAGRHCACAVPMATELADLQRIIEARNRSGKHYMMMETSAYSREFLFVRDMHNRGEFGNLTFLRGAHIQDLEGDYPLYWHAMPPMHYICHAIAPILALTGTRATRVNCIGAGQLRPDIQQPGGNTFPLQTALFQLEGTQAVAEVTRSWFQVARSFVESFSVYGDKRSFEWPLLHGEDPVVFTLDEDRPYRRRDASSMRVSVPYRPDLLPPELGMFSEGGHGGSHSHLVHEFISSIVEGRTPAIDAEKAANWTATGICANVSALRNGESVVIPAFS